MNVSLSKNEQVILFVVVFLVIAVAGSVMFLKPKWDAIENSRAALSQKEDEFAQLNQELGLQAFKAIEQNILEAFEDGKDASAGFYSSSFTNYNADRLIRSILADMNLFIDNLVVSRMATFNMSLNAWYFRDVDYELGELRKIYNARNPLDEADAWSDPDERFAEIPPPQNLDDEVALSLYMMTASKKQGLEFYGLNKDRFESDLTWAARDFLNNYTQTVAVQTVRFNIPLTADMADRLAMHFYNLNKNPEYSNTYVSSMIWRPVEEDESVGGGVANAPLIYTVEVSFFIIHPMESPEFSYEEDFAGTWH